MAESIAGPRRPRPTKTRSSRVWRSVSDVMQNRSNRGSGKPAVATAPRARASDWGPIPRIALGPAAMYAAPKGRTHGSTRPACINVTKTLANREPSTHGYGQKLGTSRRAVCFPLGSRRKFREIRKPRDFGLLPLQSGRRRRARFRSACDAVDGSTAGIAMCHGGCFITANRGAARDGSYHDRS